MQEFIENVKFLTRYSYAVGIYGTLVVCLSSVRVSCMYCG